MDQNSVYVFNISFLLFLSAQTVSSRISNFKYKKDELFELSHHLYLISTKCRTAVQCAVSCLSSPDCILADVESGNLYKKAKANILKNKKIRMFVESTKNTFDETGPNVKLDEAFLMVSDHDTGQAPRDVYIVSMKSNKTEKTGITLKNTVLSIVYNRKSNKFFWSQESGIYKQEIKPYSKKERTSIEGNASDLNIYNGLLYYRINKRVGYIYTHDPNKIDDRNLWLSSEKNRIFNLVIDAFIGCWNERGIDYSINCVEMPSKWLIYTRQSPHKGLSALGLLQEANFSRLLYTDRDEDNKYDIKIVDIFAGGHQGNRKTLNKFKKHFKMQVIFPGLLAFSFSWANQVEIWDMKNGPDDLCTKTFLTRYPSSKDDFTNLVTSL